MAALSRPSMLAAKFMIMDPWTGWSRGISGKRRWKKGRTTLASAATMPPFSPTRMSPSQRVSTPVRPSEISKPSAAISKVLFTIVVKISVSWNTTSFTVATTKATRKNPIQMTLRAMVCSGGVGAGRSPLYVCRVIRSTRTGTCSRTAASWWMSGNS